MTQRAADDFPAIAENMERIRKDREEAEKQRLEREGKAAAPVSCWPIATWPS